MDVDVVRGLPTLTLGRMVDPLAPVMSPSVTTWRYLQQLFRLTSLEFL